MHDIHMLKVMCIIFAIDHKGTTGIHKVLLNLHWNLTKIEIIEILVFVFVAVRCDKTYFLNVKVLLLLKFVCDYWRQNSGQIVKFVCDYLREYMFKIMKIVCDYLRQYLCQIVKFVNVCGYWRQYTFGIMKIVCDYWLQYSCQIVQFVCDYWLQYLYQIVQFVCLSRSSPNSTNLSCVHV